MTPPHLKYFTPRNKGMQDRMKEVVDRINHTLDPRRVMMGGKGTS